MAQATGYNIAEIRFCVKWGPPQSGHIHSVLRVGG